MGANKVTGTNEPVLHHGPDALRITVPGDGGNDTLTTCVVGTGTVTGGVLEVAKSAVDHTMEVADENGAWNVPACPGTSEQKLVTKIDENHSSQTPRPPEKPSKGPNPSTNTPNPEELKLPD